MKEQVRERGDILQLVGILIRRQGNRSMNSSAQNDFGDLTAGSNHATILLSTWHEISTKCDSSATSPMIPSCANPPQAEQSVAFVSAPNVCGPPPLVRRKSRRNISALWRGT